MTNSNDSKSSETADLTKPLFRKGRFENPWDTFKPTSFADFVKWHLFDKNQSNLPPDEKTLDQTLPVHCVSDEEISEFCDAQQTDTDKIGVIWIGHSTCLLRIDNQIILTDPLFSERCSPLQLVGPRRYRPVPVRIESIPRLDAVVISHNHYDHLDQNSVLRLHRKFGASGLSWFVGLGTARWFDSIGIAHNVHELGWWQTRDHKNVDYVFTPTQHWCARGLLDRNKCLWGSWTIIGKKKRIFFAGDTAFNQIGKKYGPFDLSLIPIGSYSPRWFMSTQHVDPEQAVQIHLDIKSDQSVAIHWGTFTLTKEFYLEPKQELSKAMSKLNLTSTSFVTLEHGIAYEF